MKKLLLCFLVLCCAMPSFARGKAPKDPRPKTSYDEIKNRTIIETVDVWPKARFGYDAGWSYEGKPDITRPRPEIVSFRFWNNRLPFLHEYSIWKNTQEVFFKYGETRKKFSADYLSAIGHDAMRGDYLIECLFVRVPTSDFEEMAKSAELLYQINNQDFRIFEKYQVPLAELAKTIPAAAE